MKVVYVAAPYRAPTPWGVEINIHRAKRAALEVWHAGAVALCPHANTAHFDGEAPDEVWLAGTLELMRRCDAVYVPGPRNISAGMRAEIDEATSLGMPVFMDLLELVCWLAPDPPA
jgi:hypothetical protein